MTFVEVVLLLVVVACFIALFCIVAKQKSSDDEVTVRSIEPCEPDSTTDVEIDNTTDEHIAKKTPEPFQNTIYEFDAKAVKYLCPFCDGENNSGAEICSICGRNL